MWKDSETKSDYLNFDYLIDAVESIAMDAKLTPSTIGVYGDWGSGKSSLMQMVEEKIKVEHKKDACCIRFNGWLFEGYEDAKTAFCGSILDALRTEKTIPAQVKTRITKLLKKVDGKKILMKGGSVALDILLTGGLGSITYLTIDAITNALKDKLSNANADDIKNVLKDVLTENKNQSTSNRNDIKVFQEEFKKILDESKIEHLVIFVDELDRCTPDTILDIFAAMRLFLFVEKTSFIIGADSRLVDYAIKSRYKNIAGNELDISKEYLEKLIQYPVTIPKLDELELERYLTCLLLETEINNIAECVKGEYIYDPISQEKLVSAHKDKEEKIKDALALSHIISPVLAAKLNGNPRQCKRFLNTLYMRVQMAKTRDVNLDKKVLSKLMLLEYFKEPMYAEVVNPNNRQDLEDFETNKSVKNNNVFSKWKDDEWVKDWLAIDVPLCKEDLKPYYYFSRSTQRVNQAINNLLSPNAQQCLKSFLEKSDSERGKAVELFGTLSDSECALVTDAIYEEMIKTEEIDMDIFKSFIETLSCKSMRDQAVKQIKKIPASKLVVEMLPLINDLKSKLPTAQDIEEIENYINQNANLSEAVKVTENLMKMK